MLWLTHVPVQSNKGSGEQAELLFALTATQLGFTVSKPFGDNARYDAVVDWGGKLSRVQIKSTDFIDHVTKQFRVSCAYGGRRTRNVYKSADVDIIVVWLAPAKRWLIVPISALASTTISVPRSLETGKYSIYADAWQHLKRTEAPAT